MSVIISQDVLKIESENGQFMGPARSNSYQYYYPEMVPSELEGGFFKIYNNTREVTSGGFIKIHSLDKETWWHKGWRQRDLLGAFGDKKALYYWSEYGNNTIWRVVKVDGQEGDMIQSGDQVYLVDNCFKKYLVPEGKWLTKTDDKHKWTLHLVC